MATDIAFAIGVLALVPRISHELKVFLLALAIVDDIGAIVVIAIFYSQEIRIAPLMAGACVLLVIEGLRRTNVHFAFPYVAAGILFWFLILSSGIHATIAGVILASMVSAREAVSKEEFDNRAGSLCGTPLQVPTATNSHLRLRRQREVTQRNLPRGVALACAARPAESVRTTSASRAPRFASAV